MESERVCNCASIIEEDIILHLDTKPEIKGILDKTYNELVDDDIINFIKIMKDELGQVYSMFRYISEIRYIGRYAMEEEYLEESDFSYNIVKRHWYYDECPTTESITYIEEDVIQYEYDDYGIERTEHTLILSDEECLQGPKGNSLEYIITNYMTTYLFNKLSQEPINTKLRDILYIRDDDVLESLVSYLKNLIIVCINNDSNNWKGRNYYFYNIFGYPMYFDSKYKIIEYNNDSTSPSTLITILNNTKHLIDTNKFKLDYYNNFNGIIKGHPLASNGIYQEAKENQRKNALYNIII